jgi:hypothetical protein
MPRTPLLAGLAAAVALAAGPARAHDPRPDAVEQEPRVEDRAPWDIRGHLRADANGLSLEIGGTRVELKVSGGELSGEPPGSPEGAHDLRASISVDGKTTNLVLRIVPPPGDAPAPEK